MVPKFRKTFDSEFDQNKYEAFIHDINTTKCYSADFRICETPLFLSSEFIEELLKASNEILIILQSENFKQYSQKAIPAGCESPNEETHTTFLLLDFTICRNPDGKFIPQLIELQGFPLRQRAIYHPEKSKICSAGGDTGRILKSLNSYDVSLAR